MSSSDPSPTTRQLSGEDSRQPAAGDPTGPGSHLPKPGHLLVGKYRIDGVLGRGGMGVVMAGHQLSLDRPVAIKFLHGHLSASGRQRFTREAMAIAKMQSQHVVRVFDAAEEDEVPFIVMERLIGEDLASVLEAGPLGVELSVKCLREACEAIAESHSLGIVHRDIKPSNLFLTEGANGRKLLKVLDFGVSKWSVSEHDHLTPFSTAGTGLVGTPAYTSPEQLATPSAVDERSDVWSLGVVLYQCLSGKRPFTAPTLPQICAAILSATPAPFSPDLHVPERLQAIVFRCLNKRPRDRYQSAVELSEALASVNATRVRSRIPLALGALGLGALGVLAWSSRNPAETREGEALAATARPTAALEPAAPAVAEAPATPVPGSSVSVTAAPNRVTPRPARATTPRAVPSAKPAPSTAAPAPPPPSAAPAEERLYRR
jgi:serine/threonine protein kinase